MRVVSKPTWESPALKSGIERGACVLKRLESTFCSICIVSRRLGKDGIGGFPTLLTLQIVGGCSSWQKKQARRPPCGEQGPILSRSKDALETRELSLPAGEAHAVRKRQCAYQDLVVRSHALIFLAFLHF